VGHSTPIALAGPGLSSQLPYCHSIKMPASPMLEGTCWEHAKCWAQSQLAHQTSEGPGGRQA
jgi:hypothetical protein